MADSRPFQLYETESGYIFDTWALRKALQEIDRQPSNEFKPAQLEGLVNNFCDWNDGRVGSYETLISRPITAIQSLPMDDRESFFWNLCDDLSSTLQRQYTLDVNEDDIQAIAAVFADPTPQVYNFYLRYLADFAQMVREFDPQENPEINDVQTLIHATRELPGVYLDTKATQYEDTAKINQIRHRILTEFNTAGRVDVSILDQVKEDVASNYDDDILRNWRDYTILGQLFYDYFKPRIDVYLEAIADRLEAEYPEHELERHLVNFQGPRNQLSDHTWMVFHGGPPGSQQNRYQLYLGIFGNRIEVGLHVGGNLRTEEWEDIKDLSTIEDTSSITIEQVIEKFEGVEDEFFQLEFEDSAGHRANQTNFFWATANPAIWSVAEIEGGGEVKYSAYNEEGNKRRLFDAFESARPGDRVIFYESTPSKEVVAEGTVTEPLDQGVNTSEQGIRIRFDRSIEGISWKDLNDIPDLQDAQPITNRAQGSLFQLSESEFEHILALEEQSGGEVSEEALKQLQNKLHPPEFDVSLPANLYFEDADRLRREINSSLNSGKHVIFTGPPGTGKTKIAKAISTEAAQFEQIDRHRFTTATSEWTAFDTIGGYVPTTSDGGQELEFEPRMFLKCFRQDEIINEWLIIDEINRADIDKAFGQLFSVLSGDSTELPYERQRTVELRSLSPEDQEEDLKAIIGNPDVFPITPSWRLLATMNTYDKTSLYEMSYAFMRRFNFIHIGVPSLERNGQIRSSLLNPEVDDNYAAVWISENEDLLPVLEEYHGPLAVLWHRINEYRMIGPAIIADIIRFLMAYGISSHNAPAAFSSAIVSLVFPQLEGLRPEKQQELIRTLPTTQAETETGLVDLELEEHYLRSKAADFFGIEFDDDD